MHTEHGTQVTDPAGLPQRALCSSCGRFVGPYETCPYCGARQQGRLAVRVVKIVAVVLATVGLLALWWAARQLPIPTVTAAEAQGTMNMAYVEVQGQVVGNRSYDPQSAYLAFRIDDGTGEIYISAYRDVVLALVAEGRVPAPGDEVTVAGTLRIREDRVSLTLNVPEHLEIVRPTPIDVRAGTLTALDAGLRVRVQGQVRDIFSPYEGLTLITVRDDSGQVTVAVDQVVTQLTGALPPLEIGQQVTVVGAVTVYRDTPQVVPASVADVQIVGGAPIAEAPETPPTEEPPIAEETPLPPTPTPTPTPAPRALGSLSEEEVGAWVRVQGEIVVLEGFSAGVKAILDDGSGQVTGLLWMNLYNDLPDPPAFDVGAEVLIEGEVGVYQGELQVVPEIAADVTLLSPAPPLPWVDLGSLTAADVGRAVRVRGVLAPPETFSAGQRVLIDDGTGTVLVILWSNVLEELPQPPEAGMILEVAGMVGIYRDTLQLVPRTPWDWRP